MKKLIALILAIALMATMSIPGFAAEVDQDTVKKEGETIVSFDVDPTYIVTIPATVTLNKETAQDGSITYENDYTITADAGVRLHKNENIVITVASDYEMTTDEGATLDYTITKDGAALVNDVVATFTTSTTEQVSTIHIAANDPEFAGEYEDTVTFTISLETPAPATISFTIDEPRLGNKTFQADVGMTWREWVASSYNTDGYTVEHSGDGDVVSGPNGSVIVLVEGFIFQSPDDVILADHAYEVPNF